MTPTLENARRLERTHPLRVRLDDLLTRCFYSGAGYVFECDPYALPDDDDVFGVLAEIRADDRRHAHVIGSLIQGVGGVPGAGVFPWWDLDLNYLTVPCLARFVVETMEEEQHLYESLVADWPKDDPGGRAALASVLADQRAHLARLRPVAEAATKRETDRYKAGIAAVKTKRAARLAKEKAAADAARKAKAAAAAKPGTPAAVAKPVVAAGPALLDPKEPGISPKERGRRTVLAQRAASGKPLSTLSSAAPAPATAAAPAAPAGAADVSSLADPNEPGISPKEKARRAIARQRAAAGGGAPASAPAAAAPAPAATPTVDAASLPDPDEPGISPKEKGRRTVMRQRAMAGGGGAPGAAPAAAPAPSAAPPPAPAAPAEELLDPDEPGISPKEKGRRTVLRMRAKK